MVQDIRTALDSSRQKMLDKLVGLNGADFTKQYQSDQVSALKDAVSLADLVLRQKKTTSTQRGSQFELSSAVLV